MPARAPASKVTSGTGVPSNAVGASGDWYLDEAAGSWYRKVGAAWAAKVNGGAQASAGQRLVAYNGIDYSSSHQYTYQRGYAIGLAYSDDAGGHFYRMPGNPILVGTAAAWDDSNIKDPCLLKVGRTWHLYYSGADVSGNWQIGHATSVDGATWTKDAANPIIPKGSGWEAGATFFPFVTIDAATGIWHMWYCGGSGAGTDTTTGKLGHATSPNGWTWTKDPANPILAPQAGEQGYIMGCALKDPAGLWRLFYQAYATGAATSVVCELTSPDAATWTRLGTIVTPRTAAVQAATGNIGLGALSVAVANSSVFAIGEPIYVEDTISWEVNRVAAIPNGTTVTLLYPTANAYTTANTAQVAGVFQGKQTPRSVVQENDGWVLYCSAYGGGVPGGSYHEDTGAIKAPSLAGPWAFDFTRGVLIDKRAYSGGTAGDWDAKSAENPSVVPYGGVVQVLDAARRGARMRQVVKATGNLALLPSRASSSTWYVLSSPGPPGQGFDGWLSARVGDIIKIEIAGQVSDTNAVYAYLDFVVVNYSTGTGVLGNWVCASGASTDQGNPAWRVETAVTNHLSGAVLYTVMAADLSAGAISLRPMVRMSASGTGRTLSNIAAAPFFITYENLGGIAT